jgi:putative sigma-54 modulation protein
MHHGVPKMIGASRSETGNVLPLLHSPAHRGPGGPPACHGPSASSFRGLIAGCDEGWRVKIAIRSKGKLPDRLRAYVERRIRFALSRFGNRIQRVTVRVADLNGPRGGVDRQCRAMADLGSLGRLTAESVDDSVRAAVDRTVDRIARSVARTIEWPREQAVALPGNAKNSSPQYRQTRRRTPGGGGTRNGRRRTETRGSPAGMDPGAAAEPRPSEEPG